MGEDKSVEKQVSPAVQEALDLANKANDLKEKIEEAEARDSNDVDAVIKKLVFCIEQHTLNCRQLISQISETLAPGESSQFRRMKALDDLAQIDRLNEMLALKISHRLSAGRYDGMGTLTLHHGTDKMGIDGVLTFPNSRFKMGIKEDDPYPHLIKVDNVYTETQKAAMRNIIDFFSLNKSSLVYQPLLPADPIFVDDNVKD